MVDFYSVTDVAELTGKSVQSVRSWCRKNEIERDGRRYLITSDVLSTICRYYHVETSELSAFLESKEKLMESIPKVEKARKESAESNPLLSQMQVTLEAKQEQIDLLKELLEQAKQDRDRELERLTAMYTALSEKYDKLQEEHRVMLQALVAERFKRYSLPSPASQEQEKNELDKQETRQEKKSFLKRLFG